jgi:DNA-binding XRE family transcriptional regulator
MALYRSDRLKTMNPSTHPAGYNSMAENNLKRIRESMLMSKSELARDANVSPITISRIEQGKPCRMETKRKLLMALGLDLSESQNVFGE